MRPLIFKPIFKTVVWGGESMAGFKGIDIDGQDRIGESWEVSGVEGMESVLADGPAAGAKLNSILSRDLLGKHVYEKCGGKFPLLIKFIDAAQDLSLQVHPSDELALRRHGTSGKTEMWYVVDAEPEARIISGLAKPITPDDYDEMVANGTVMDAVASHKVSPGDVFFIPAGRIHALCKGCFVAEIQQTSDLTYRIFDYNRPGLDGKPRTLHTELAREAIDYRVMNTYRTEYELVKDGETVLSECPYFVASLCDIGKPFSKEVAPLDSFLAVMCIEGKAKVHDHEPDGTHCLDIRRGQTMVIPGTSNFVSFIPEPTAKLITAHVP